MRTSARAAALLLFAACAGGGDEPGGEDGGPPDDGIDGAPQDCPSDGAPVVEVGLDDGGTFTPLPDEVAFTMGIQGGYFVMLQVRAKGLRAGDPTTNGAAENPGTTFVATFHDGTVAPPFEPFESLHGYRADPDGWCYRSIVEFFEMIPFVSYEPYLDTDVTFTVEVEDVAGVRAVDARTTHIAPTARDMF